MKKILILLAMFAVCSLSAFANDTTEQSGPKVERHEEFWTNLSYYNVPILKIIEAKEGYIIIYQKYRTGTGSTVIPKGWARGNPENPRKLKFRDVRYAGDAYMSVMKEDGEFLRVVVNVPRNRLDPIWGIASSGVPLEGADKDVLEDLDL